MAIKVLFYAINGMGMGHLSRQYAIAKKLRTLFLEHDLQPDIRILTTSEADFLVQDFPVYKIPSVVSLKNHDLGRTHREYTSEGCHFVFQLVSRFQPDILILDTQPQGGFQEFSFIRDYARMNVFIQRHVRSDHPKLTSYLEHINLFDLVLVPDQESQKQDYLLDAQFKGQRAFIGTVSLWEKGGLSKKALREYFGFSQDWPVIYVSAGGGGDKESRDYLDKLLLDLSKRQVYILAGYGPLHHGPMLYRSNLIPLREPLIQRLFSGLDYAISAAGYNTYQELLAAGVPTLFYHQKRGLDQQDRRVLKGFQAGWHGVLKDFSESEIDKGFAFLEQESAQIKENLKTRVPVEGALKGAEAIFDYWQTHYAKKTKPVSTPQKQDKKPAAKCFSVQHCSYSYIREVEKQRILFRAQKYFQAKPVTLTSFQCERSQGNLHDFYSEADYWWPNPKDLEGAYIRKDGESNPHHFFQHRISMIRLADIVGAITSAYLLTKQVECIAEVLKHLKAWFVTPETRMNPSLEYAQAIPGQESGRFYGLIDSLHLIEVARSLQLLEVLVQDLHEDLQTPFHEDIQAIKNWFQSYNNWLKTHPYGIRQSQHKNNHSVTYALQLAVYARLLSDQESLAWAKEQFKNRFLPLMMNQEGGFIDELTREKPYSYSLFMLEVMSCLALVCSDNSEHLWHYTLADGRSLKTAIDFMHPFIQDKSKWPFKKDVQFWDKWPVRQSAMLFAALEFQEPKYLQSWCRGKADPTTMEVLRNLPIRHPLLWIQP